MIENIRGFLLRIAKSHIDEVTAAPRRSHVHGGTQTPRRALGAMQQAPSAEFKQLDRCFIYFRTRQQLYLKNEINVIKK